MVEFFEGIKEGFQNVVQAIIDFLPTSPITFLETIPEVKEILPYVNWFLPVSTFIAMTELWLVAIGAYYIVQIILRWIKVVE